METSTRQRKVLGNENGAKSINKANLKSKKQKKSKTLLGLQGQLLCAFLSLVTLTIFTVLYYDTIINDAVDKLAINFGYKDPLYATIIDAGSTGSRIITFSFHRAFLNGRLILDKELFIETKPGLSSFANDPKKGAESIKHLLEYAYNEIPKAYWSKSPLVLKATAGLRMLPEMKANNLLNEVQQLFIKTPFLTDDNSVTIMDGVDEGIFSWVTVNFLLGLLNGTPKNTVAALDLGGGSNQVTFASTSDQTLLEQEYIHTVRNTDNQNIQVYTRSFLGVGLQAARKNILKVGNEPKSLQLASECINPIINGTKWYYNGKEYSVSGVKTNIRYQTEPGDAITVGQKLPIIKFEECLAIAKNYVINNVVVPEELITKKINAFSYFFDRATESGLIDPSTGGTIVVEDFLKAAKLAANTPNTDQPFMTLDLTFIYVLLKDGFGLKPTTKLNLKKKLNGHEVSWALGAALKILQS